MKFSLKQAAEETGLSKTTIFRSIKSGRLSAIKDDNNRYTIEASELFRVFQRNSTCNVTVEQHETKNVTPETAIETVKIQLENDALKRELEILKAIIEDLRKDRDDWKNQAAIIKTITNMREKKGFWSIFRKQ